MYANGQTAQPGDLVEGAGLRGMVVSIDSATNFALVVWGRPNGTGSVDLAFAKIDLRGMLPVISCYPLTVGS